MSPITELIEVTGATATGPVELRLPLVGGQPGPDEIVFAMAASDPTGPWEIVPASVEGNTVTIRSTHLSVFEAFRALLGATHELLVDTLDSLTSDLFERADAPSCQDEPGAREDGYGVLSDSGDALFWCLGRDSSGRFLRVVNNRRYAILLTYRGMVPIEQSQLGLDLVERLSRAAAFDDEVPLFPRETVTFRVDLEPGADARVASEYDGVANALLQLQMGIETAASVLTRFGTSPATGSRLLDFFDDLGCVDAVGSGDPGQVIRDCFDFDLLKDVFGVGAAALLTPVMFATSALSYFQSELNALGDQFRGRDRYVIGMGRAEPAPPSNGNTEALPTVLLNDSNIDQFEALLVQAGLGTNSDEEAGCTSLTVLGVDFSAGDADVLVSYLVPGERGYECGGDALGLFTRVRNGTMTDQFGACGDCEPGTVDATAYLEATEPYRGRVAPTIYPWVRDAGWHVWSYENDIWAQ